MNIPTRAQLVRLTNIVRGYGVCSTVPRKGYLNLKGVDKRLHKAGLIRATYTKDTAWMYPWNETNKRVIFERTLRVTALGFKALDFWY